jgi:hypothetical protein
MGVLIMLKIALSQNTGHNYLDTLDIFGFAFASIFAITMLYSPCCELQGNQLIIYGLLGFFQKKIDFQSTDQFQLDKGRLYLHHNGRRKRIQIPVQFVEPTDWNMFLQALNLG